MHVINYSRDSEVSGAGFCVWMVSRVSFQGLYDRVSLQSLHGGSEYFGGPNITWQITKSTAIFWRNLVKPSSYIFRVNIKRSWESSSQNQAITAHNKPNQIYPGYGVSREVITPMSKLMCDCIGLLLHMHALLHSNTFEGGIAVCSVQLVPPPLHAPSRFLQIKIIHYFFICCEANNHDT